MRSSSERLVHMWHGYSCKLAQWQTEFSVCRIMCLYCTWKRVLTTSVGYIHIWIVLPVNNSSFTMRYGRQTLTCIIMTSTAPAMAPAKVEFYTERKSWLKWNVHTTIGIHTRTLFLGFDCDIDTRKTCPVEPVPWKQKRWSCWSSQSCPMCQNSSDPRSHRTFHQVLLNQLFLQKKNMQRCVRWCLFRYNQSIQCKR